MIPKEYRIATREGFIEVFWEDLYQRRRAGENVTQVDIYYELEGLYFETYGRDLFPSFDAFRVCRDTTKKNR